MGERCVILFNKSRSSDVCFLIYFGYFPLSFHPAIPRQFLGNFILLLLLLWIKLRRHTFSLILLFHFVVVMAHRSLRYMQTMMMLFCWDSLCCNNNKLCAIRFIGNYRKNHCWVRHGKRNQSNWALEWVLSMFMFSFSVIFVLTPFRLILTHSYTQNPALIPNMERGIEKKNVESKQIY